MNRQTTGNVGLYQVCARLSEEGFNVMPTARNAKGVDIVGYNEQGKAFTVQVKTLTTLANIGLGSNKDHFMANFFVIVVLTGKFKDMYLWSREEMEAMLPSEFTGKDGKVQYWLQTKAWTKNLDEHKDTWRGEINRFLEGEKSP